MAISVQSIRVAFQVWEKAFNALKTYDIGIELQVIVSGLNSNAN